MDNLAEVAEPTTIAKLVLTITRGVTAGWIAGVPQVVVTQIEGQLLGIRGQADIGPRFMRRTTQHTGRSLTKRMHWLLGGVFHFEYAAGWGVLYGLLVEGFGWRRVPPWLSGALLASIIYAGAFSRAGGATRTGSERPVEQRSSRETVMHWSAATTFALTTAYAYRWLHRRW